MEARYRVFTVEFGSSYNPPHVRTQVAEHYLIGAAYQSVRQWVKENVGDYAEPLMYDFTADCSSFRPITPTDSYGGCVRTKTGQFVNLFIEREIIDA